jgi:hypothetical protein
MMSFQYRRVRNAIRYGIVGGLLLLPMANTVYVKLRTEIQVLHQPLNSVILVVLLAQVDVSHIPQFR